MPSSTPLPAIGRERELATLRAALDQALSRQAQVTLLTGEPGIGKTWLARTFESVARECGVLALGTQCHEQPGAPAYWPWIQIFRGLGQHQSDEALGNVAGNGASCIAEIWPELQDRVHGVTLPQLLADPAQARFRLFDAIAQMWARVASEQPVLLLFDDLHWADVPSLRLLEFVVRETRRCRLLIVATLRDALAVEHPALVTLAEMQRASTVHRLALAGFSLEETSRLLERTTGSIPSAAISDLVQAKTGGNPFFVTEIAHDLDREGLLASADPSTSVRRVPEGIRAFIANRLTRVSPATRRVLHGAAVVGTQFDVRLVRAVIDDLPDDHVPIAIADAHSERIVADAGEPGCYQFTHALVRDVLYQDLPALERARMHERVGAALEVDKHDGLMPPPALLAYHFGAALPAGSSAKAIAYATAAAEQACVQLAYEEAARYYGLALGILERAGGHDPRLRCKLTIALASARMKAGHAENALDALAEAADQASRLGAVDDLTHAALELEEAVWRLGLPGTRAIALLEASLERLREDDHISRARLHNALVRALAFAGERDRADRLQRETLQLARRLGDPQTLAAALRVRFWLHWEPRELEALLATSYEAMALAVQLDNAERVLDATAFRMHLLTAMGDMHGFATDLQRFAQLADELQQPFHQYHAASMRSAHALWSGRFAEAEALSRTALRLGTRLDGLDASGSHGLQMFTITRERGELGHLAPLVKDFVRATPSANMWRPALALILAELGELDAAKTELSALAADDFRAIPRDSLWLMSLAYLSEVCGMVRNPEHARTLYALLGLWQGRNVIAGSVVVCYGPVDRFLGTLCHVLECWDDAERHFQAAVEMNSRQGSTPWLAHTQYCYAAMLLERNRDGDMQRAHTLMASAAEVAEDLDMQSLQHRLGELERLIRERRPATLHPAGLSPREVQVLGMIAEGRSNQQIADAIFRSPNTVANHVRSILSKLGAANRTEAAAFAAHRGWLQDSLTRPARN